MKPAATDPVELSGAERARLKATAQRLEPVVFLGKHGVTPQFLQGVETAVTSRELIKVKFTALKDQRHELAAEIATQTGCALITVVGHVAVFYRPKPATRNPAASSNERILPA